MGSFQPKPELGSERLWAADVLAERFAKKLGQLSVLLRRALPDAFSQFGRYGNVQAMVVEGGLHWLLS